MPDSEIDYSDIPKQGADFFKNAVFRLPVPKDAISVRIDHDVLDWFKSQGRGYQTRINAVMRMYAEQNGMKPGHNQGVKKHEKVSKK